MKRETIRGPRMAIFVLLLLFLVPQFCSGHSMTLPAAAEAMRQQPTQAQWYGTYYNCVGKTIRSKRERQMTSCPTFVFSEMEISWHKPQNPIQEKNQQGSSRGRRERGRLTGFYPSNIPGLMQCKSCKSYMSKLYHPRF